MTDETRLLLALLVSGGLAWALTPLAARVALRTGFLDRPVSYKQHAQPMPYLGGVAVVTAFLLVSAAVASELSGYWVLVVGSLAMLAIGTVDDRVQLGVTPRLTAQVAVAVIVWLAGSGWEGESLTPLGAILTVLWVVGITNALNLMDNMDGACGTVAATSATGIGVLAAIDGNTALMGVAFALAGSCAGFLLHNLARPARIFLGDGGSTPIGFALAFLVMALPTSGAGGVEALIALLPLVGLAVFDTSLVVVSRTRHGLSVLEGGRDHLTHRLAGRLGSPQTVAVVLMISQALLCVLAGVLRELDSGLLAAATAAYVVIGAVALLAIDGFMRSGRSPSVYSQPSGENA